jgi:deoxyribose-phosphate aldolase
MQIEYINVSQDLTDKEISSIIKDKINNVNELSTVVVPQYFVKLTRGLLDSTKKVSCLIDYPLGLSDTKSRSMAALSAIKNGANYIDIVLPSPYLTNRKYDKIREDIRFQKENIDPNNIRYILEYRAFDHNYLRKMCDILVELQISTVVPSSGYRIDNLADFIIASEFLRSHFPDLNIILSANFWNNQHFEMICQNKFFAIRGQSLDVINDLILFNINHKK